MKCKKCGKNLEKNEKYCEVCGYNNSEEEGFKYKIDDLRIDENEETTDEYFDDDFDDLDNDDEYEEIETSEDDIEIKNNDEEIIIKNETNDDEYDLIKFSLEEDNKKDNKSKKTKKKNEIKNDQPEYVIDKKIEAYVGEDYKWIIKRKINIYAFLLSWVYFLYRKMYIIGIIGLGITGIVYRLYPKYIIPYAIFVMILSAFIFNPIYKAYILYKIKKIEKKYEGSDNFSLEEICKEKGGTSVSMALLIFLIFTIIMLSTYYKISYNKENTKYWSENSENKANCISTARYNYNQVNTKIKDDEIDEAVCNIRIANSKKMYDVYFKLKINDKYKYIYFKDEKDTIEIEGLEVDFNKLQEKSRQNIITENEKEVLNKMLEINKKYNEIYDESIQEDKLIKNNKNNSEKINYIITRDEILR